VLQAWVPLCCTACRHFLHVLAAAHMMLGSVLTALCLKATSSAVSLGSCSAAQAVTAGQVRRGRAVVLANARAHEPQMRGKTLAQMFRQHTAPLLDDIAIAGRSC
jgi:hypothetical protein